MTQLHLVAKGERTPLRRAKERTAQPPRIFAKRVLAKKQCTKTSYCKTNPHSNLRPLLARAPAQYIIHSAQADRVHPSFYPSSIARYARYSLMVKTEDCCACLAFGFKVCGITRVARSIPQTLPLTRHGLFFSGWRW